MNIQKGSIRDFIYLDLPKVSSIFSQITGGLVTGTEITTGSERDQRNIRKYDLKIFTPEFGGAEKNTSQMVESRVMHHDLFNRMEQLLLDNHYAIDINESLTLEEIVSGDAHKKFAKSFYIRCSGWPIFEDYEKMKFIAKNHNKLVDFIAKSALSSLKESSEYKGVMKQIDDAKIAAKKEQDRNKRGVIKGQIDTLEKLIHQQMETSLVAGRVDEWIINGFSDWVDIFIRDAIYFHIYPFETYEQFHIKAALKRDNFMDGDIKFTDFAYSGRPNVKLSLFGLITSIPPKENHPFDPMKEFEGHVSQNKKDDPVALEAAFRGLFRGFDGLDKLSKFERYPNLTVYPLAIFRDIYPFKC